MRIGWQPEVCLTRTVELGRECVRVVVPTDLKAAFEADSLENIVGFWTGKRGWLAAVRKVKAALTRNGPREQNPTDSIGWATLDRRECAGNMLDICYRRFVPPSSPPLSHCR